MTDFQTETLKRRMLKISIVLSHQKIYENSKTWIFNLDNIKIKPGRTEGRKAEDHRHGEKF